MEYEYTLFKARMRGQIGDLERSLCFLGWTDEKRTGIRWDSVGYHAQDWKNTRCDMDRLAEIGVWVAAIPINKNTHADGSLSILFDKEKAIYN